MSEIIFCTEMNLGFAILQQNDEEKYKKHLKKISALISYNKVL